MDRGWVPKGLEQAAEINPKKCVKRRGHGSMNETMTTTWIPELIALEIGGAQHAVQSMAVSNP